eukprot:7945304-Heterocapsa_arctica.AAC.1
MGTNPAGTHVPPFDSQRFEHWHAWETQPECGPQREKTNMARKLLLGKVLGTPKINNLARKPYPNKPPSRIDSTGSAASDGNRKA